MDTDILIRRLAASAGPVRPLPPPWRRTARWLAIGLPWVALVVVLMSPRADLAGKLGETRFLIEQAAAFATAVTAAVAAFCLAVPGYGWKPALLPLPPLALWLGTLGLGCLESWLRFGDDAWRLAPDWVCFPSIVMVGALPALVMVLMLRRGAPMAPRLTVALGALAAAALGNFGLRLFHPQDASLMVLVWQFGSVVLLTALAGWIGTSVFYWPHGKVAG